MTFFADLATLMGATAIGFAAASMAGLLTLKLGASTFFATTVGLIALNISTGFVIFLLF